jgi:hypothetical protein
MTLPTFNAPTVPVPLAEAETTPQYHSAVFWHESGERFPMDCLRCVHQYRLGGLLVAKYTVRSGGVT